MKVTLTMNRERVKWSKKTVVAGKVHKPKPAVIEPVFIKPDVKRVALTVVAPKGTGKWIGKAPPRQDPTWEGLVWDRCYRDARRQGAERCVAMEIANDGLAEVKARHIHVRV